jgi:hypothetical protein
MARATNDSFLVDKWRGWLVPPLLSSPLAFVGGVGIVVFSVMADFLQQGIPMPRVLLGAGTMTAVLCLLGWLIYRGLWPVDKTRSDVAV